MLSRASKRGSGTGGGGSEAGPVVKVKEVVVLSILAVSPSVADK
jgi:hypothetical protein